MQSNNAEINELVAVPTFERCDVCRVCGTDISTKLDNLGYCDFHDLVMRIRAKLRGHAVEINTSAEDKGWT